LLIFPLNSRLADFLEKKFVTQEETEGQPRYLDKIVAVSPPLALNALALELSRVTAVVRRMGLEVLRHKKISNRRISADEMVVQKLSSSVAEFITHLEKEKLSQEVSAELALILRAQQHLLASADQAALFARLQADIMAVEDDQLLAGIKRFHAEVASLIEMAKPGQADFSYAGCERQLAQIQLDYDELKASLLKAGAELRIAIPLMIDVVEQNSRLRRMARQLVKAMNCLNEVFLTSGTILPESAKPEREADAPDGQKNSVAG
jgi:phosphate:Na+ symporter